jgi:nucleotide-binding universal stress UspA family protein
MYKHILVAIGPSLSESALTAAIARARECNARLSALHIVDPAPWWAVVTAESSSADTLAVIDDHARAVMRYCAAQIERAGIDGSTRSMTLPPSGVGLGEAIANAAAECGADLIVLGGEAQTGWRHDTARLRDVVCAHTACDVLIASHGARRMFGDAECGTPMFATGR